MKTEMIMKSCFLLLFALILNVTRLAGAESRLGASAGDLASLDERVQLLRGNDGSWRIPDPVQKPSTISERQGLRGDPLTIHDVTGEQLGEVFQIHSYQDYVGLLVVVTQAGRERGLTSGFSDVEWPLNRVSRKLALNDLNNALFEPKFYLVLDEDRLLLRVNLGKRELEFDDVYLDAGEIHRGSSRDSGRSLER